MRQSHQMLPANSTLIATTSVSAIHGWAKASARAPTTEGVKSALPVGFSPRDHARSVAAGIGQKALDAAREYAGVRKQFGLPIGKFEGIEEPLARSLSAQERTRLANRVRERRHGDRTYQDELD